MKEVPRARELQFEDLRVGDTAAFEYHIEEKNVNDFARLSGDYNPLHVDEAYASATPFGARVTHGMLLGALVSRLVGMQLPGRNALLMKEELVFGNPVRIGDMVRVEGKVTHVSGATRVITLSILVSVGTVTAATGTAYVQVRA